MTNRDRDTTRARLIQAVATLIGRDGFGAVRINAVAREAGVDKVLIYRYFGGLSGLLEAFGEEGEFWWRVEDLMAPPLPGAAEGRLAPAVAHIFDRHVAFLRTHPVTLEIIAWELSARNELTIALESVRERRSTALMEALARHLDAEPDALQRRAAPVLALLGAAANYLAARARHIHTFGGVPLSDDADWRALSQTVQTLLTGLDGLEPGTPAQQGQTS